MSEPAPALPAGLFDRLDPCSPVPIYHQVSLALEAAIRDGVLPEGTRLESELALSSRLGVSRPTIRHAIAALVDKGLLIRNRGAGTVVRHRGGERAWSTLSPGHPGDHIGRTT